MSILQKYSPMRSLKLDINTGFLIIPFQFVEGKDKVRQDLQIRLKTFYKEWFLDTRKGVKYKELIFQRDSPNQKQQIQNHLKEVILGTKDVVNILYYKQNWTQENDYQVLNVDFTVSTTDFGNLTITQGLSINNIGIPITPQNNNSNMQSNFTANETIEAFKAVGYTGHIINSNNINDADKFFGITTTPIASGLGGQIISFGEITNPLWNWNTGDTIFINGTSLSNIPPTVGWLQVIGEAVNSTTIFINSSQSIIL